MHVSTQPSAGWQQGRSKTANMPQTSAKCRPSATQHGESRHDQRRRTEPSAQPKGQSLSARAQCIGDVNRCRDELSSKYCRPKAQKYMVSPSPMSWVSPCATKEDIVAGSAEWRLGKRFDKTSCGICKAYIARQQEPPTTITAHACSWGCPQACMRSVYASRGESIEQPRASST